MNRPRFITKIDWDLLQEQKEAINAIPKQNILEKQYEAIIGITNLIDSLQDYAVDSMGMSEKKIF